MRYIIFTLFTAILITFFSFGFRSSSSDLEPGKAVTFQPIAATGVVTSPSAELKKPMTGVTGTEAMKFVEYAKTFIGTPYVYGSVNPAVGFDCSGFINHVSQHFGLEVPRSSVEFTNMGKEINQNSAQPGDLILFTGTNPAEKRVGHIGIVIENPDGNLQFIHSSSGKANGVTISELSDYYKTRFVKVIRILPDNSALS